MARKTEEQKEFEEFVSSQNIFYIHKQTYFKRCKKTNVYENENLRLAFKCWQESARRTKQHYQG